MLILSCVCVGACSFYQLGHKKENVSAGKAIVLVNKGLPPQKLCVISCSGSCRDGVVCSEDGARGLVIDEPKQARDLLGLDSKHAASINVRHMLDWDFVVPVLSRLSFGTCLPQDSCSDLYHVFIQSTSNNR